MKAFGRIFSIVLIGMGWLTGFYLILTYVPEHAWFSRGWTIVGTIAWAVVGILVLIQLTADGVLFNEEDDF